MDQFFWRILAVVALLLAAIGVVLPGVPTTPFLLVAAWGGARGWPALDRWLLAHPSAGPAIRRWREQGAVPRKGKWAATLMMSASLAVLIGIGTKMTLVVPVFLIMLTAGIWIWSRPDG